MPGGRVSLGLIVTVVLGLAAAGGGAAFFWLQKQTQVFALTLSLKTPQGEREIRVVGTEVTLEERERKASPVLHNCAMNLMDFYAFRKLARATLSDQPVDRKLKAGTYLLTLGDADETASGNGDVDAQQAATLSDFIVKRVQGCVDRSQTL